MRSKDTRPLLSRLGRPVAAAVLGVGVLGMAGAIPTAGADAVDDSFLAALRSKGIKFGSPTKALTAGHEVCDELGNGKTPAQVASTVESNSGLDDYHAGFFVGASISAYCPKYSS
jgi:Protein of unknown function (DUF732)